MYCIKYASNLALSIDGQERSSQECFVSNFTHFTHKAIFLFQVNKPAELEA